MKQNQAPHPRRHGSRKSVTRKSRDLIGLSLIIISLICSGCFRQFYSTNTANQIDSATLVKLIDAQKYFILHDLNHNRQYALINIKLSNENLVAEKAPLPQEHELYEHPVKSDHNAFPVKDQGIVLYEVHLYSQNTGTDSLHINIPLKDFGRIDVYALDKQNTNKSKVGSIIGVTLTTAAIIGVIIAASETNTAINNATTNYNTNTNYGKNISCSPQVFIADHNHAELQGTLYSGAIAASLERSDYLPLTLTEHSGDKVRLTIIGKDEEDIILKRVQLIQVTHKESEQVLIDRKGKILVYQNPVKPSEALIGHGQDILTAVMARDGKYYSFTNHAAEEKCSDILLNFRKPLHSTSGKLIVNAKNSNWSYFLFNQFKSLYGDYYPSLIQKKDEAEPARVMQCELDQYMPLLVSVKYKEGWKFVDYFPTAGISNSRDLIMNLDLSEFRDSTHIQIKMQTTYMFWDLDYVAMDFSTPDISQNEFIPASRMLLVNGNGETFCPEADQYSNIIVKGPLRLELEFDIHSISSTGMKNSYFLAGNGYYHDNSQFTGKARFGELSRFSGKGAFDQYSREKFDFLLNGLNENEHSVTRSAK